MQFPRNPPLRFKIVTGWRAVIFAVSILAIIAVLAFLAFSAMVIIVPLLMVGAVVSLFFPKPKIGLFRRTRRHADGVIDAEYKVVELSKVEQKDGTPFDQSNEV
jgi:5-bromo-4-chloroindolyl phosphate hydrolysis protein